MDDRPIKRVLVLSGGGARGAYQVGVCKYLYSRDRPWKPDMILGNSIGATNGAILTAPRYWAVRSKGIQDPVELLEHVWRNEMLNETLYDPFGSSLMKIIHVLQNPEREADAYKKLLAEMRRTLGPEIAEVTREINDATRRARASKEQVTRWFLTLMFNLCNRVLERPALIGRTGWRRVLRRYVNVFRLRSSAVPYFGIAATDVMTGALHTFWNRVPSDVQRASSRLRVGHIMSSSSIPAIYRATRARPAGGKARYWWDGALDANAPVGPALDIISDVESIVVVLMVPWLDDLDDQGLTLPHGSPTMADALTRFLDWMMLAPLRSELRQLDPEQRKKVWIVAPPTLSNPVSMIDYRATQTRDLIARGFEHAMDQLRDL